MAIKKTIELDVNTKAGLKAMDELGLSFEEAFTEADNLSGQIGELEDALYAMAAAGQQNTQEYKDLSAQIGVYKKVIIDTDMSVDALSQTTAQKMGGALGGVTAGFELGAGAMGAFGMEGEKVEEALLRVQSAMAISQGIDGIRQAIPAFKAMKMAIMSNVVVQKLLNFVMSMNPIGIIIAGVVALGAALYAIISPLKTLNGLFSDQAVVVRDAVQAQKELNEILKENSEVVEKANAKRGKSQSQLLEQMVADGATEKELHEERLKQLSVEQQARDIQMKMEKEGIRLLRENYTLSRKQGEDEQAEEIREQIEAKKKSYEDLKELQTNYNHDVSLENKDFREKERQAEEASRSERLSKYREYLAKRKELEDTALAVAREIEAGRIELMEDGFEKESETIRNKFLIQREDLLANEKLTQSQKAELQLLHDVQEEEALRVARENKFRAETEAELLQKEKLNKLLSDGPQGDLPNSDLEIEIEAEEIKGQALFDIRESFRKKDGESEEEYQKRIEELGQGALGKAAKGLMYISDLSNTLMEAELLLAGDNEEAKEKARKKGFERSKKMQIGMAIIQGIQGTMAAFTAGSAMGPAGVVMGPLMAGLAAATSVVNIAKIAKTQYQGGGGGDRPEVSGGVTAVPTFNIAGNSTENQLAQSLGQQEQAPIKAMVVSTEVTTAQSLDRNKIDTATL